MADLTRTTTNVRPLESIEMRTIPMIADEAVEAGQPLYRKANGRAGLASAAATGILTKVVGIATTSQPAGKGVEALYHGRMVGYDLSGADYGAAVYLSDTAGEIGDAAGTVTSALGTVHAMTDVAGTKFVFFDISQAQV